MAGPDPSIRTTTGAATDGRDKPGPDLRIERSPEVNGVGCWYYNVGDETGIDGSAQGNVADTLRLGADMGVTA
jgi:hypothetical protein